VGSHRLWAADILVFLLLPSHSTLDRLVAQSQLLPRVAHLSLTHDTASTLHARMPQMLRNAMASRVPELWQPLLQPGLGLGLQLEGAPCPPLHTWLVTLGECMSSSLKSAGGEPYPAMLAMPTWSVGS
jgi:hypothetical protein